MVVSPNAKLASWFSTKQLETTSTPAGCAPLSNRRSTSSPYTPAMIDPACTPAPAHSQEDGFVTVSGAEVHIQLPYMAPTIAFSAARSGGSRHRVVTCPGSEEAA